MNGRHRLAIALDEGNADAVVYYCSAGHQIMLQTGGRYKMLSLPAELAIGPEYGLTISHKADPAATDFALYVLSPRGQKVLKDFGFIPVTLPSAE